MTQDTMEVQRPKKPRRRVRPNRKAQDQRIILMWIKRIGIGIMVLLLLGQAYRLVAVYQEKQHIEQQLQELKQRNEELGGCMAIEVGNIIDGTVSGITKFGVFVDLGEKKTGLVHISEVAHGYVEDINTVLKVEDPVKVKVLSIEGNKIGLSIRQTQPKETASEERRPRRVQSKQSTEAFEAKMKSFLRDSNERLHDLKRNTEGKRGGRGGRRD